MADPLFCPWLINAPCLKSEIWAAWAQALLSGVGIIAAAWLPNRAAQQDKKDKFHAVVGLMIAASMRMHLIAKRISLQDVPVGERKYDEELTHLTAALDAIPAHELPEGGLLYSIKGVRREVANMNELYRRVTDPRRSGYETSGSLSAEARRFLAAMQPHIDEALALGKFRYGGPIYRLRHRLNNWRKRRAATAGKT